MVKNLPAIQETWVQSLGWKDPLEKEMATHSSILAWKIPWTEESGRLQSMRLQRVRHDWATTTFFRSSMAFILKSEKTLERIYKQIVKINDLKSGENNIITAINYWVLKSFACTLYLTLTRKGQPRTKVWRLLRLPHWKQRNKFYTNFPMTYVVFIFINHLPLI